MQDDEQQQWSGSEGRLYSASDFRDVIQKQVAKAACGAIASSQLEWDALAPFLEAARDLCRSDFEAAGIVQVHGMAPAGEALVEAEEAYVEVSIADQEHGEPWLTQTFWLSDLIIAGDDPDHVRASIRGLERSIERLKAWLERREGAQAGAEGSASDGMAR